MLKIKRYETKKSIRELIKQASESGDWSLVQDADVSNVTDMPKLFHEIKGIVNLDLSSWDTSNVTNDESDSFERNSERIPHPLGWG